MANEDVVPVIREADPSVKPARVREGRFTRENAQAANAILERGKLAIHGDYENDKLARGAGASLSKLIEKLTGNRWGITTWKDGTRYVGALEPRERRTISRAPSGDDGQRAAKGGKRSK